MKKLFWPGYIGLNNLRKTDYLNVLIQAFSKVEPFKNYILRYKYEKIDELINAGSSNLNPKQNVVISFMELVKKMWNSKNFKGNSSPHELT